tara:strand:+ start:11327 stop:11542 length:216 start_codon:yes stop_codon:yes gene_type:complete
MKIFNNTKRSRFKITTYSLIALFLCLGYSMFKELNDVGVALVVSISATISIYGWSETKRPSKKRNLLNSEE